MPASEVLRQKFKELEFVTSASRMLNATLNFEQLLRTIMKIVKNALNVQAVLLSLVEKGRDGDYLVFELARGRRDRAVRGQKMPFGEGVMGRVAKRQKPLVINDTRTDKRVSLKLENKLGLHPDSVVAVPLRRRGRLVGVLEAINRKDGKPFTEADLSLAITLGEHIAISIANARLFSRAERRALEYSLLANVSADLGKSISLNEVLEKILKNLQKLVPFDAAAVFVFDRDKQRLVSMLQHGYPKGADQDVKVKRDEGVVSLATRSKKGIIVDDVRESKDYVNARNKTRSEIVAPMLSHGTVIGAFNLESNKLRAYRDEDLRLLEAFAGQASVAIERAQLYEERREKHEIEKELRVARTVQDFFSPKRSRAAGPFRFAGVNYPSLEVSGDYYDFFPVKNSRMAFAIADVAGKGVPASLIMSGIRAAVHTMAPYTATSYQITKRANKILMETVRPQDFVTAFIGVLDPSTGEITYCNAGHNPPVLMSPDGSYRLLESGGPVLGVFEDYPLVEGRLRLTNETLLCYTDGATESQNDSEEEYGEERLIATLKGAIDLPPSRLCRTMFADLKEFLGDAGQDDDVTYLVLKRRK
ncbi:MAG: SpoIIE family protein phosphatase [Candidatus Latescibacterota bacterium]|jgi:serine phosphatase RsbU (regulator of sigma subunit)